MTTDGTIVTTEEQKDWLTLPVLLHAVVVRRRLVVGSVVVSLVIGLVSALTRPTRYTSTAAFMAGVRRVQPGAAGALGGLAAQLGIPSALDGGAPNPQFYADVVTSRRVLLPTIEHEYSSSDTGASKARLPTLLGLGDGPAVLEDAIQKLQSMVKVTVNARTGLITIRTTTKSAHLSFEITEQLIAGIERFNVESRQAQATSERQFMEARMVGALSELREAEATQTLYLQRNRDVRGSPALQAEAERLLRDVQLKQQVYTVLVSAFEQARIEQLRDTPLLNVVDRPSLPVKRDPKGRLRTMVGALILGTFGGLALVFGIEARNRSGIMTQPDWVRLSDAIRDLVRSRSFQG